MISLNEIFLLNEESLRSFLMSIDPGSYREFTENDYKYRSIRTEISNLNRIERDRWMLRKIDDDLYRVYRLKDGDIKSIETDIPVIRRSGSVREMLLSMPANSIKHVEASNSNIIAIKSAVTKLHRVSNGKWKVSTKKKPGYISITRYS